MNGFRGTDGGKNRMRFMIMWLAATGIFFGMGLFSSIGAEETLRVVTPSWNNQTNEDGTGLFFEIVRAAYARTDVRMTHVIVPWKRAISMVKHGDADAMLCVWKEHADEYGLVVPRYPMFVEHTACVFPAERKGRWRGIESLAHQRIIWLRGYDYHATTHLGEVPMEWSEVDDYDQAWGMLKRDRVDYYIDALIDIDQYVAENHIPLDQYEIRILWGQNAYVAFTDAPSSPPLMDQFDKWIRAIFDSGELKAIYEKWGVRFSPDAWAEQVPPRP